jgi:polar amino acid transport system permease protein/octopine/nopaline transport system permease protein/arginine/ornithine transport system permease protein
LIEMIDLKGYEWQLVEGLKMTVVVAVLAFGVAILFGLAGAAAKLSKVKAARSVANAYTVVIRGVPELILLILFYFGVTQLLQNLIALFGPEQRIDINPFLAGMLTIGFVYGAFATEVFRGAIQAVPKGQIEAAKACGMSDLLILRRVLLPQVWRFALPGLGNVWLVLLKATALMSVVNLDELARKAQIVANNTKQHFTVFLLTAVIYLVLTALSSVVLQRLERHANRGVRRA